MSDVQGLIVYTEDDRFVTINRAGRARVWRVDLSGEPVDDVDRTGVARELDTSLTDRIGPLSHHFSNTHNGGDSFTVRCTCSWQARGGFEQVQVRARAHAAATGHDLPPGSESGGSPRPDGSK